MVDVVLPASQLAPKQARDALAELAPELSPGRFEDARLLASELVTNSVRHAATGRDARVRFRAEARRGWLRVEVTDWGEGFEPGPPERPEWDSLSGYGLFLVDRVASRWGVERARTTLVWFELDDTAGRPASDAG